MKTISAALSQLRQSLNNTHAHSEANAIAIWAMESLTGKDRSAQIRDANNELEQQQELLWQRYTTELLSGRPVQYVTGISYFFGLTLMVNENVLIPRPETEELVDRALKVRAKLGTAACKVLDIGTGSGCIALAFKSREGQDEVVAIDLSEPALAIAKKNADSLQLPIQFVKTDILEAAPAIATQVFDLILSNPPYITIEERAELEPHVVNFEPASALFVTNHDPLQFYKAIEAFSQDHLAPNGRILLELNQQFAEATEAFFVQQGWKTTLHQDLNLNPRILQAFR